MLTRSSLQSLLDVDQPLRKVYALEYKDPDTNLNKVFNIENMSGAQEMDMTSYGVGALENVGEGGAVPYDDTGEGYKTTYAYQVYKKGVQITEEMFEDNRYREMRDQMKWLAQRASYDPVNYGYGVLRNAFTAAPANYGNYNAGALALCSNSQTYENGDSGTQDNYSTSTLSYDSYEAAEVALMEQKSGHGTLIEYTGKLTLVVPPALKREAIEITESEKDPDTAENAVNVFKGRADVVVVPYLGAQGGGSDTAWYLISGGHKLNFFWRKKPTFEKETDFDTDILKYKVKAKYVAGFSDWRGVYGSAGTA